MLGVAGPVYRLGASLATAYEIMRWAEYIGLAALVIAIGSTVSSYRGRRWMGTIALGAGAHRRAVRVAIPLAWQRRAQRLPSIHDITTDLDNPPAFQAILSKRAGAPNRLDRNIRSSRCCRRRVYPDLAPVTLPTPPGGHVRSRVRRAITWLVDRHCRQIKRPHRGHRHHPLVRLHRRRGRETDAVGRRHTRGRPFDGARGAGDLGRNASRIRRFLDDLGE